MKDKRFTLLEWMMDDDSPAFGRVPKMLLRFVFALFLMLCVPAFHLIAYGCIDMAPTENAIWFGVGVLGFLFLVLVAPGDDGFRENDNHWW